MDTEIQSSTLPAPAPRPEIAPSLGAISLGESRQPAVTALALGALVLQLALISALDGVVPTLAIVAIAIAGGLGTTVLAHSLGGNNASGVH